MGRPPSKFVTQPPRPAKRGNERKNRKVREDYFTRAELVALEQSWLLENAGAGKMAFYHWYAKTYLGIKGEILDTDIERVRQLFRDAKVRARQAGWLEPKKG